jgi:simple sugar transport system substrate-binding protein
MITRRMPGAAPSGEEHRTHTRSARAGWTAAGALALAVLAGCSQAASGSGSSGAAATTGSAATGAAGTGAAGSGGASGGSASTASAATAYGITGALPAKLAGGTVKIALVRQLSQGDFFEQWLSGAQAEARALHVNLEVLSGNGDNAQQATYLQQAINEKVSAIIVDHGFAQTMQPVVAKAAAAHIPLVAFDLQPGVAADPVIDQDDPVVADEALNVLKQDSGGKAQVIYAYVAGYRPLDLRNGAWVAFKKANPGIKQVAQIGVVNSSTVPQVADQAKAALEAHPGVTAIFAPYDAFAQGATLAVNELGLQKKVKIYGGDISTADIGTMTAANSPWVVTAATDPADVGRVAVRAAALLALGDKVPLDIVVPPQQITQQFLLSKKVVNMTDLRGAIAALSTPNIVPVP